MWESPELPAGEPVALVGLPSSQGLRAGWCWWDDPGGLSRGQLGAHLAWCGIVAPRMAHQVCRPDGQVTTYTAHHSEEGRTGPCSP